MKLLRATCSAAEVNAAARSDGLAALAAAGVIHDLGNLIQIASSAINIIARTPHMPAMHAGPMLERAKTCLQHAGELVHQNIGFIHDRITEDERTSVAKCLSDVAALVEALGEPGLDLVVEIEPNLPKVECDAIGMRRAILNLVFNARDAIQGCGTVQIEARAIWHGHIAVGVEVRVVDRGVGMAPATVERVFEPFFTTKPDGVGGLGLSTVTRFARDARGEVAIESEQGVGTIVTLRLPAIAGPDADLSIPTKPTPEEPDQ